MKPTTKRCPRCGILYEYRYDNHNNCPANLKEYSTHTKDLVELTSGKEGYRLIRGFNLVHRE